MTGTHDYDDEKFERETCKQCLRKQKIKPMQCGPGRYSSFHDSLVEILPSLPKPKEEKPEVRYRLECRGKPRHEPPVMEFAEDSALKFLDDRPGVEPKVQAKPAGDGSLKQSNFKSKAVYCEVGLGLLPP